METSSSNSSPGRQKRASAISFPQALRERPFRYDTNPSAWMWSVLDAYLERSSCFYYKDLLAHYGSVNAIEFSPNGQLMASGGDDKRVLLWHLWKAIDDPNYSPRVMEATHLANIFTLVFDAKQTRLYSGGADDVAIVHSVETGKMIDVLYNQSDIYSLSVMPSNNNIFACASSNVRIWDLRARNYSTVTIQTTPHYSVEYHPRDENLLLVSSSYAGLELFDVRRPGSLLLTYYPATFLQPEGSIYACYSKAGDLIFSLPRDSPPVLYNSRSPYPLAEFDSEVYHNSSTIKNCSFVGEKDQYVIAGSDSFDVNIWKIPDNLQTSLSSEHNPSKDHRIERITTPYCILKSHRSIPNQVKYNHRNGIIATSGVEKIVKLWSPAICFHGNPDETIQGSQTPRPLYTRGEYLQFLGPGDIEDDVGPESFDEDRRILAYFDYMITKDLNPDYLSTSDESDLLISKPLGSLVKLHVSDEDPTPSAGETFQEVASDFDEDPVDIQKSFMFNSEVYEVRHYTDNDYHKLVFAKRTRIRYFLKIIEHFNDYFHVLYHDIIEDEAHNAESDAETHEDHNDEGHEEDNDESHDEHDAEGYDENDSEGHDEYDSEGHEEDNDEDHDEYDSEGHEEDNDEDHDEYDSEGHEENDSEGHDESDVETHEEDNDEGNEEYDSEGHEEDNGEGHEEYDSEGQEEDNGEGHEEYDSEGHEEDNDVGHDENDSEEHDENDSQEHDENDSDDHEENDAEGHEENDAEGHNENAEEPADLNSKIAAKKMFHKYYRIYKLTQALIRSFATASLFKKYYQGFNYTNFHQDMTSQNIQAKIKYMSKISEKKIFDKKLFCLLQKLLKKTTELYFFLRDNFGPDIIETVYGNKNRFCKQWVKRLVPPRGGASARRLMVYSHRIMAQFDQNPWPSTPRPQTDTEDESNSSSSDDSDDTEDNVEDVDENLEQNDEDNERVVEDFENMNEIEDSDQEAANQYDWTAPLATLPNHQGDSRRRRYIDSIEDSRDNPWRIDTVTNNIPGDDDNDPDNSSNTQMEDVTDPVDETWDHQHVKRRRN